MTNLAPAAIKNVYGRLAIENSDELIFGHAPRPVTSRKGLTLGAGRVYPELNFTLPTMVVEKATMPEVGRHYREIVENALARAVELECEGLVLEFETLPPMTENPDWGMEVVRILLEGMAEAEAKHGLKTALRVTPNDTREMERPPVMRSGALWEGMLELFERSAQSGADFLSIESVGGKEVSDEALMMGDLPAAIFALCVLGVRDMRFLWSEISHIALKHGAIAAGDTACGFANTAMVLAEKKMIPRSFAAVIRAVSAVRSLAAYECGAQGPGKDCGYENVILKAITGCPMAMEGRSATCAHGSPVGNVAAAACDTWSNESVQNIRLLGGYAPVCSLETLIYDCRLFNTAIADGPEAARQLRDWHVRSDIGLDPQALVLAPESAVRLGHAIVRATSPYRAGVAVALEALALIEEAFRDHRLKLDPREADWVARMRSSAEELPDDEDVFIRRMLAEVDTSRFLPREYELD